MEKRNVTKLRFKGFEDEWKEFRLGDIVTFYDNLRKPIKGEERNEGIYPYYGATGIIDYINDFIFEGEYLLLGEDGANIVTRSAPLIYKTKGKFWVNNHAHIFYPKENFNIDYLKQALERINYIPYNSGTAQPKLNIENVKKVLLKSPGLEEQTKIANFLSNVDNIIEEQEGKVKDLEQYKKGMMQKIFKQEVRFRDENGGEYPEWEDKKLKNICSINQGLQIAISDRFTEYKEGRYFYITNEFLKSDSDKKYYIENPTQNVICDEADILMTRTGNTGKVVRNVSGAFHNNFFKVNYNRNKIFGDFMYYFLTSNKIQRTIMRLAGSSTIPDLNHNDFYNIKIKIPCIEEQTKIANFLSNIDNIIEEEKKKLEDLKLWKKGLLQQMFV
ncbi:restriction endonuclease subunit S [Clostridium baratii]